MLTEAHEFNDGVVLIRRERELEGAGVGRQCAVDEFPVRGFKDSDGCEAEWVSGEGVDDRAGERGLRKRIVKDKDIK